MKDKWQNHQLTTGANPVEQADKVLAVVTASIAKVKDELAHVETEFHKFELLDNELRDGSLHDYADQMFGFDFIWEDREKLNEIKLNVEQASQI